MTAAKPNDNRLYLRIRLPDYRRWPDRPRCADADPAVGKVAISERAFATMGVPRRCGNTPGRGRPRVTGADVNDDTCIRLPLKARDGTVRAWTVVSAEDEWVSRWDWRLHSAGYAFRGRAINRAYYTILLHRVVMDLPDGDPHVIDHINADKLDNRRANLRVVTQLENVRAYFATVPARTHCERGHALEGANRIEVSGRIRCRECKLRRQRKYDRKRRGGGGGG